MNTRRIITKISFLAIAALFVLFTNSLLYGQTLLGTSGGLEGGVVVDNTTLATSGATNTWQKATATQTIALETTIVRSGANSLSILNTSTTGRRVYSPLFDTVANGSRLVLQYYRRRLTGTGQENQHGIAFPTESLSGTYTAASAADTWEKVTYVPTATTAAGNKWALILHRLATGGNSALPEYIDDVAVYVGTAVDNLAPNDPTGTTTGNPTANSLDVSWTAASGGVDNGGYLVVRDTVDPTTAPNVNGIYAVGNTIGTGKVVYMGTGTSFTDAGLSQNTQYFYRVYTYDKAFNYSTADEGSGMTSVVTAASATVGGRVTEANGRGIFRARVTLVDSQGVEQTAYTNTQGYYSFPDVPGGQTYVFTVRHLRYQFAEPSLVEFVDEDNPNINFVSVGESLRPANRLLDQ